ncbi:MAG: MmgE/PrpD family protein [Flavimaricola sp.]|nr:MmgE/PrpD family protein [Flavimaricola sp.]
MTPPEVLLARFAHGPVADPTALAVMRLSVLDWAACGLAGRSEDVARLVHGLAIEDGGRAQATLFGGGQVPAPRAALVNGTTSHALDFDDTHFAHIGHPSVGILPAALAVAEAEGADMTAFLAAALVGVEASVRVGVWLGRGHYQTGFHQTATAGAFGATLAAARLMGLDQDQTVNALGLAATRASGLKSQFGTMGKPYNAGLAAETGVEAARLARVGMTSSTLGLSGDQGFGPTHHGAADLSGFADMGDTWLFPTVSHKFHACCHGLHAMLEALAGGSAAPANVVRIDVQTHPRWLTVCNIAEPATGLEAKFSYRLTAAMALSGVPTGAISSFVDATAARPDLVALRDRVHVTADSHLTEMQARVTLTLQGGQTEVLFHDLDAPLPLEVRADKIRTKARALTPLADALEGGINAGNLTEFVGLIGSA